LEKLHPLPENEKDQEIGFDSVDRENVHNILNSPITEEKILRVVKNLKSNKASGYDDIVNEHIKSTINIFLPIYCFVLIFTITFVQLNFIKFTCIFHISLINLVFNMTVFYFTSK
jgi:hypothetical protein